MSSHTSLSDLCNPSGFIINISKQLAFETKKIGWVLTLTLSLLHSKTFDVADLPVLTFGKLNCVLKTGVTK